MNYIYYLWLLLLVVLSTYSEGPQLAKLLDASVAIASPVEYSAPLGILASVLPQNEVLDLGISIPAPLWLFLAPRLPQNEVLDLGISIPTPLWVFLAPGLPQNEVLQNLSHNGMFKSVPAYKCDSLSRRVQNMIPETNSILTIVVGSFKNLTSTLIHGGGKLGWAIRITLECLQHILRMYIWSLSENQASVSLKCRLIGLFSQQSLLKKHDFAVYVYKLYQGYHNLHFRHLGRFLTYKK